MACFHFTAVKFTSFSHRLPAISNSEKHSCRQQSNPRSSLSKPQKSFLCTIHSFTYFCSFISNESTQCCWQMTLPIIFLQHKAYRWSPQVPAWKTADLRGTSCLINSSRKRECFPCTDWYTPPFAFLASRDIRPCTSRAAERYGNSGTTCSNTGLVCDLSVRTVSLFMWQYLNPPRLEFRPLRRPYGNGF